MKTYKTIKELPKIPVGTEFKYGGTGVVANSILQGECTFLANYFGIHCWYFEEVKPKSYKRWRAEKWGRYYYIDTFEEICLSKDDLYETDNHLYTSGNYYQTEEEAIFARDRQLFITKVNDRILELNEGWVFWQGQVKTVIKMDKTRKIEWQMCYQELDFNEYGIILLAMRDMVVAESIIDEFRDDLLKYIFN